MARSKKFESVMSDPGSVSVADPSRKMLYWAGMLPANGSFKWPRNSEVYNEELQDYLRLSDETTQSLFSPKDGKGSVVWRGKCKEYQGLSVNGFQFSAFSEVRIKQVGTDQNVMVPWPGCVVELDADEAKAVVDKCYRKVLRNGKLLSLDHGIPNPGTDPKEIATRDRVHYNPKTDTFAAYYIYLIPLEKAAEDVERSDYIKLVPDWDSFFADPPKSVQEMYPQEKVAPKLETKPDSAGK